MDKHTVHCIFGVMYMHFWYAMHRQLWWCLVGVITIVQCIFGALFLGLGCNIFLVVRLWCYALSAISRRLATAVAHLLYHSIFFWQKGQHRNNGTNHWQDGSWSGHQDSGLHQLHHEDLPDLHGRQSHYIMDTNLNLCWIICCKKYTMV